MQSNKLFVAGFPYALTDQELSDAFARAGTVVSAKILMDRDTGRSRGFGFVEMSTEEEAQKAIEMFNEKELDGRKIIVNEARPMESRPQRGGGGFNRGNRGGFGGGRRDNW